MLMDSVFVLFVCNHFDKWVILLLHLITIVIITPVVILN